MSLYSHPALYHLLLGGWTADLPFYRSLPGDPVLECGVGTGRVALALAADGRSVHGVDVEPAMLDELRRKIVPRVTCELADVRTMDLGRRFPLVIAPYNVIARQLLDADLEAFLRGVRRHLEPDGRFAFDVWRPGEDLRSGFLGESPRFPDPRTGRPVRCTESYRYDAPVLSMNVTLTPVDDEELPAEFTLRFRVIDDAEPLLARCGFDVIHRTDRFTPPGAPETGDAGDMTAYVCRPAIT